jgi:hypothetical protein
MDADPAGWKATRALVSALIDSPHTEVQVALLIPPGEEAIFWQPFKALEAFVTALDLDLSDYVKRYGGAQARKVLLQPISGPGLLAFKNPPPPPPRPRGMGLDQDISKILNALVCSNNCTCQYAVKRGYGNVHCPAHEDPKPSFSVKERDGKVLVHCFGGCDQSRVIQALVERDLWRKSEPKPFAYGSGRGASGHRSGTGLGWYGASEARLPFSSRLPRA